MINKEVVKILVHDHNNNPFEGMKSCWIKDDFDYIPQFLISKA